MDFPEFFVAALEKLSVLALAIFAGYTNWKLFVPFFAVGVGMGLHSHMKDKSLGKTYTASSCSQSFIEGVTGVKLPRIASLAGNVGVAYMHAKYHAPYIVWLIALAVGAAVGKALGYLYDQATGSPTKIQRKVNTVNRTPIRFNPSQARAS